MLTPHETIETSYRIEEPIRFVNIIARRTYSHTSTKDMKKLKNMITEQYGYNPKNFIDQIITNKILINSVLNN